MRVAKKKLLGNEILFQAFLFFQLSLTLCKSTRTLNNSSNSNNKNNNILNQQSLFDSFFFCWLRKLGEAQQQQG